MLENEANEKALSIDENRKNVFCPKINDFCRIDCECYAKAEVYNFSVTKLNTSYEVIYGHCTNFSLKGNV